MDYLDRHPFVRSTVIDKIQGTMVGSALGDCIGLYTEFLSRQTSEECYPDRKFSLIDPVTERRSDSHRDKFEPATWSDDTDHALLITLSYLHHDGELILTDFAARLRSWCEQGLRCLDRLPLGLGRTVKLVVFHESFLQDAAAAARKIWIQSGRDVAANGSLMRTHPLGIICLPFSREERFQTATKYSQITHVDPRCVVACCISTTLIADILTGKVGGEADVDHVIEESYEWVVQNYRPEPDTEQEPPVLDRAEFKRHVYAQSLSALELDDSQKMGYVYKSLGAAILCLRMAMRLPTPAMHAFEDIITDLVLQGGDADTNACCAGALLGAWLGYARLPAAWRDGMAHSDWLLNKTNALCQVVGVAQTKDYSGIDDPDTATDQERGLLTKEQLSQRELKLMEKILLAEQRRRESQQGAMKSGPRRGLLHWKFSRS